MAITEAMKEANVKRWTKYLECMEKNLQEEFGNYISPNVSDNEESDQSDNGAQDNDPSNDDVDRIGGTAVDQDDDVDMDSEDTGKAVVLHEGNKHCATTEKIYSADVEALVMDGDAQPL